MTKTRTFWPYGILLSILAIIIACIVTIVYASKYPVYQDDFYFDSYQNVENNYNEIQKKQELFNQNFSLELKDQGYKILTINEKTKKQAYGIDLKNRVLILDFLHKKSNVLNISDFNISIKLTRPHTSDQDKFLNILEQKNNKEIYIELPQLDKGRWQLKVKMENDQAVGFKSFDFVIE